MAKIKEAEASIVKMELSGKDSSIKSINNNNKIVNLQKLAFPPSESIDAFVGNWKNKLRVGGIGSFIILVILPTFLASAYYFFIASNQYASEAKFLVRSSDKQQVGGLGALLQTTGIGSAPDETYSVIDFLGSRDGLKAVDNALDYGKMMGADGIDFWSRFPNFLDGDTFEGMYDHYQRHVTALHDASSGVSELTVKSFTPEDAQKIASTLLDAGEALINRMNERALNDALEVARSEVALAEQRVLENQLQMKAFRVREGIVDPEIASEQALKLISELDAERAKIQTELSLVGRVSPDSVRNTMLQEQLAVIQKQLAQERAGLVSSDGSLVGVYAEYEKMSLEAEFAAKSLLTAEANLASARVEAGRKQLYLERIVEPHRPDYARYPKRLMSVLTVFMTAFLIYAIIWLLYVNAREHKH